MLDDFWSNAVRILQGQTHEWHQWLVRDMVDDGLKGCEYLHATLDLHLDALDDRPLRIADEFLKVMAHRSLLDSLSLDTYVGTMYNIISGTNGQRAIPFLLRYCNFLLLEPRSVPESYGLEALARSMSTMLDVLAELLRRERRASFHDTIPQLFSAMDDAIAALGTPETTPEHQGLRGRVENLRVMVGLATDRVKEPATSGGRQPGPGPVPLPVPYPLDSEFPSGKHDNDHLDIRTISIIPTPGEISSAFNGFLPSTNIFVPHFLEDVDQRYLDTHFRLLRHDTFGVMNEILYGLILQHQDGAFPTRLPDSNQRAYIYPSASISHLWVSDKGHFEVYVTFSPPSHLHKKNTDERRRWWENSKRLEAELLLACCARSTTDPFL